METTEKKVTVFAYDAKILDALAKGFCIDAKKIIEEKDYYLNKESNKSLDLMIKHNWKPLFEGMSKNRKKKFNKFLNKFNKSKSLCSMNRFFHFLYNKVLILGDVDVKEEQVTSWWKRIIKTPKNFKRVKVELSQKHFRIQEKRKKWKEVQAEADDLLAEYKMEKGNYYKKGN